MIQSKTSDELEARVDQTVSRVISVESDDEVILSELLLDDGMGYRPFHPLVLSIDGIGVSMPAFITPGRHVLELGGEAFEGAGLLIEGSNLQAVKNVEISFTTAQVAVTPQYYEGDGHPDVNPITIGALNGARYKDRVNKFRYERSEGEWLQLAS